MIQKMTKQKGDVQSQAWEQVPTVTTVGDFFVFLGGIVGLWGVSCWSKKTWWVFISLATKRLGVDVFVW